MRDAYLQYCMRGQGRVPVKVNSTLAQTGGDGELRKHMENMMLALLSDKEAAHLIASRSAV